jgi:8-oxo-dGTP diphosphatase
MREINRIIVVGLIFSKDGKVLMGKKDPKKGGVYPDLWHFPGGGVDEGETLEDASRREMMEEVGIDIAPYHPILIPEKNYGTSEKTLKDTGEKVLCHMEFNYFRIEIKDRLAGEIKVHPSDDLVECRWVDRGELADMNQVPGSHEFLQKIGLL